ncbi:Beta-lactamase domain protein OS=Planctomyces limnophilus (strain ATCC 43296 / DSM 3776 / IFAM 1008 / 290) GN=Plim_3675 PE=4 SV=1: Lactamase_B_2 [Gemmataceae bacterium]|nr:Beta-lactamase domain protein OS=Planctomyces limnophilus (strain ATCC 43296 / DSM 3776 / IFAM 1008 / 290) GN=Plim_3675 PE=4 SV=1: Lactamase_B_2 [Gemmataceae bacterium]VTU02017.1 Beta-lactamase domain protein OS=Planctomyces limnophilus (strain ATCC 43296 / DSM 3776 / IFAM 1008 / 290) GN=Plim_3675 PE=4 SV=1: Lactamase_B_2 [Gemmataceae bacterium]
MAARAFSTVQLVNGSTGDPVLYLDYPGGDNALLFDGGENGALTAAQLGDLEAVFLTHHHVDHFIGLDRIVRANMDRDKVLHLFGPVNTIRKVYDRITAYEYPFFPFQKIVVKVTELLPGVARTATLECTKKFPEPVVEEAAWAGPVCYENADLRVEAVHADHTVPCLAFALSEKSGFHPDPLKLAAGALRPGVWVQEVLKRLRAGDPPQSRIEINGGSFALETLAANYFTESAGARVAYVTDTLWSDAVRPDLVKLAKGAWRLYCDSFYASGQAKQALQYKHMLAPQAAELAKLAKVEQLVLIHFATRYAGKYQQLIDEAGAVFPRVTAEVE